MTALRTFCPECRKWHDDDLIESELTGDLMCEACLDNLNTNAAEAAWERHCEDFHDGGSTQPWNDGQPTTAKTDYIK